MLTIKIIAVGSVREKFYTDAIAEYAKRLQKYCKFDIVQIPESNPQQESVHIAQKLKGYTILCDINGALITSEALACKIQDLSQTTSTITFIIGGSDGVGSHLDEHINEKISFGRITLPHQLFRVILTEQIYRALTISRGEKYHK
jgi:23S rRNA (pseudouridine1915-N3)-methyltransferase